MLHLRVLAVFAALLLVFWVMVPIMFMSPASAFAAGGSASDSQYQDPLAGATSTAPTNTKPAAAAPAPSARVTTTTTAGGAITATSKSTSGATVSSTPKGTPSNAGSGSDDTVVTAPSTLSPTAPPSIDGGDDDPSGSLPMTGLNVEAVAAVGVLLFVSGVILRWRTARQSR